MWTEISSSSIAQLSVILWQSRLNMAEFDASRTDAAIDKGSQAAKILPGINTRVAIDDAGRRLLEHLRTYIPQNVFFLEWKLPTLVLWLQRLYGPNLPLQIFPPASVLPSQTTDPCQTHAAQTHVHLQTSAILVAEPPKKFETCFKREVHNTCICISKLTCYLYPLGQNCNAPRCHRRDLGCFACKLANQGKPSIQKAADASLETILYIVSPPCCTQWLWHWCLHFVTCQHTSRSPSRKCNVHTGFVTDTPCGSSSRHVSRPDSSASGMGPRTASSAALQIPSVTCMK